MKRKANTGEIARARRERGRVRDLLGDKVESIEDITLIHLAGAVGLRISVALGQRGAVEELLKVERVQVPFTVRETP